MATFSDGFEYNVTIPNLTAIGGWSSFTYTGNPSIGNDGYPYSGSNAGRIDSGSNGYVYLVKSFPFAKRSRLILAMKFRSYSTTPIGVASNVGILDNMGGQRASIGWYNGISITNFFVYSADRFPSYPYYTSSVTLPNLNEWFLVKFEFSESGIKVYVDKLKGAGWENLVSSDGYASFFNQASGFYHYNQLAGLTSLDEVSLIEIYTGSNVDNWERLKSP